MIKNFDTSLLSTTTAATLNHYLSYFKCLRINMADKGQGGGSRKRKRTTTTKAEKKRQQKERDAKKRKLNSTVRLLKKFFLG